MKKLIIAGMLTVVITLSTSVSGTDVFAQSLSKTKLNKTKAVINTFKSMESADKPNKYINIRYKSGYNISWKKVKGADGYKVYTYGVGTKKWSVKKITKKTNYIMRNMLDKDNVKVKVRAYCKFQNGTLSYGKYSKTITVKVTGNICKKSKKGKPSNFYDKYAAEQAFQLQNQMRRDTGVSDIKWSDALYKVCVARAKEITKDYSHSGFISTSFSVFKNQYGILDTEVELGEDADGVVELVDLACAENIDMGPKNYKEVMQDWKDSKGHYENFTSKKAVSGAIACYYYNRKTHWVAIFGYVDVDKEVENRRTK